MIVNSEKDKNSQIFQNNLKFYPNLAKTQDIKIFKIILLSQETTQYPFFKP